MRAARRSGSKRGRSPGPATSCRGIGGRALVSEAFGGIILPLYQERFCSPSGSGRPARRRDQTIWRMAEGEGFEPRRALRAALGLRVRNPPGIRAKVKRGGGGGIRTPARFARG